MSSLLEYYAKMQLVLYKDTAIRLEIVANLQISSFGSDNQRFCCAKQRNGLKKLALPRFLPINDFIAKFALDGGKCAATH